MGSIVEEIVVARTAFDVWDAVRDVGAVHTRLAPGFVTGCVLQNGVRRVTFGSGMEIVEPIVSLDDARQRVVWTAQGGQTTHYNASMQVFDQGDCSRIVWTADFMPDSAALRIGAAMKAGMAAILSQFGRAPAEE